MCDFLKVDIYSETEGVTFLVLGEFIIQKVQFLLILGTGQLNMITKLCLQRGSK